MTGPLADRILWLRSDVVFLPQDDGLVIWSGDRSMRLKGRATGLLGDWLSSELDGRQRLGEAMADLPPSSRAAVQQLIPALLQHGFVQEFSKDEPGPESELWQLYPEQLEFLSRHSRTPTELFKAFRKLRFRVGGESVLQRNLIAALADYGALHVAALPVEPDPALAALVDAANRRDEDRRFTIAMRQGLFDEAAEIFIDAGDGPSSTVVDRLCGIDPCPAFAGLYRLDGGLGAVLHLPSREEPSCLKAFAAHASRREQDDPIAPAAAGIAAHHIVLSLFCESCGVASEAPALLRIDQDRLVTEHHRILPHPACRRHARPPRRLPASRSPVNEGSTAFPRSDVAAFAEHPGLRDVHDAINQAIGALTDTVTGPLLTIGEGDVDQLPFARSRAKVALLGGAGAGVAEFECVGLVARETRNQVALTAIEHWACDQLMIDSPELRDGGVRLAAGWSEPEALFRAFARQAERGAVEPGSGSSGAVEELVGGTPTGEHLLALAASLDPRIRTLRLTCSPVNGGWIAGCVHAPAPLCAFAPTPRLAATNLLFRILAGSLGQLSRAEQGFAQLMADESPQAMRRCLDAARAELRPELITFPSLDPQPPILFVLLHRTGLG